MAADPLSRAFAALADPTRRDMVARLALADATLTELATSYDVSVQAVSKHLRVLEDAGLVSRRREAQTRPVHLEAQVLDLMTGWIERYRREAQARYERLDAVLAELDPGSHLSGEAAGDAAASSAASSGAADPATAPRSRTTTPTRSSRRRGGTR
ncbi:MAG: metalloregulator ArsR/SmtB family transcription factor [Candidatus Nanopelagicales bacterium]